MKLSKKIASVLISAVILSSTAILADEPTNPFLDEPKNPFEGETSTTPSFEPGEFEQVAQNNNFIMYFEDETGSFYIESKKSGEKWYSNPQNKDDIINCSYDDQNRLKSVVSGKILKFEEITTPVIDITSYADSVMKSAQKTEKTDKGIKYDISFPQYEISLSLIVELTEYGIEAYVDTASMQEKEPYCFYEIEILPFFFAGDTKEEGSIFVPDGAGALISFNDKLNLEYPIYEGKVYCENLTTTIFSKSTVEQSVRLPVYGIIKPKSSMLAVINSGAADATIYGKQSTLSNVFNAGYANFSLRTSDLYIYEDQNKSDMQFFQEQKQEDRVLGLSFYLVDKENATYVDLAKTYSKYLTDKALINEKVELAANTYVNIYGGTLRKKSFLGIPLMQKEKLTSFAQAKEILSDMQSGGLENIVVRLENWSDATIKDKIPLNGSPSSFLGGKKGLKSLIEFCNDTDTLIYLDASPTKIKKGSNIFSSFYEFAKNLRNIASPLYTYRLNVYFRDSEGVKSYFLTTNKISKTISKIDSYTTKNKASGVSLSNTNLMYADYRLENTSLQQTTNAITKGYEAASNSLMLLGGNDYMLKTASHILNAPNDSSRYNTQSQAVPFYQIALHGYTNIAGEAINQFADYTTAFLSAVETGSCLNYTVMHETGDKVNSSYEQNLYNANYDAWKEIIKQFNEKYAPLHKKIYNQKIKDHEKLAENVYKTVYEDGTYSVVNYSNEKVTTVDGEVEAFSFIWGV